MLQTLHNIVKTRCGGAVERCHVIRHNGSYNNAQHSWGVAMLMYHLWPEDFPRLAAHCLTHDIPEAWVGDSPAPLLWALPEVKKAIGVVEEKLLKFSGCPSLEDMTEDDHKKLKSCDSLELYFWCLEQMSMGNYFAEDCKTALDIYLEKDGVLFADAKELFELVRSKGYNVVLPAQQGIVNGLVNP